MQTRMVERCKLCNAEIPEPAEDSFCEGCGEYICEGHFGFPIGAHQPEAHDEDDDDENF